MTALRHEAIQLVEQVPEEQMPYIIEYIKGLNGKNFYMDGFSVDNATITPKMKAFMELEGMLVPVSQELDYDKELEEARMEKYGRFN